MKRRSFLALLGLTPVAAALPDVAKASAPEVVSRPLNYTYQAYAGFEQLAVTPWDVVEVVRNGNALLAHLQSNGLVRSSGATDVFAESAEWDDYYYDQDYENGN